jgi:hypothetical protein
LATDNEREEQRAVVGAREAVDVAVAVVADAALVLGAVEVARAEQAAEFVVAVAVAVAVFAQNLAYEGFTCMIYL